VARKAWDDGMRRAVALVPRGDWGDRVLAAFSRDWQARGGTLIAAEHVDQPVELAQQIADLLQLRQSEGRAKRLQGVLDSNVDTQPSRRQDIDFIFLASTPQQARQIKPTLAFQYAGDLPVYATSNLYTGQNNPAQDQDLNGIRFCETPWLLQTGNPLRQQVVAQWPQAASSLGRLYAMGADAYRLAPRLPELKALPSMQLDGFTGNLSLAPNQRIQRQLPWAEFRNGQAQPLENGGL
jgi:outer membrane PBP1 activator LpoA protein